MVVDELGTATSSARLAPSTPVTLVQFPRVWGRNVSPFGLKLETWLKLADVPFVARSTMRFAEAPKGKLPYIVDGGRTIGDSTLIIEHLKRSRGIDPDAELSARERSDAVAIQRLFEDHLYFVMVWSRWLDGEAWPLVARAFFAHLPAPVRPLARVALRRRVAAMLHAQGIGRHDRTEIVSLGRTDLAAVSAYLGDRPFFMGDRLSTIDAVAFGFLANILMVPLDCALRRAALEFPNLVGWCETMEEGLGGF